jgi:hypothetical protein
VPVIPVMGVVFMALGGVALVVDRSWGNPLMMLGFGVVQIGFGLVIARRYGG